jgi:septal ring factor EnvC (AmiA/AmiB activator)
MIRKFIKWFITPSQKHNSEDADLYAKIVEMEKRISKLEEENIETSNCLYELQNSIEAVDARIDILTIEAFTKNVRRT